MTHVVFTTPLELDLVEGLRQAHPEYQFTYPADLLLPARYPAEHRYPDFAALSDANVGRSCSRAPMFCSTSAPAPSSLS